MPVKRARKTAKRAPAQKGGEAHHGPKGSEAHDRAEDGEAGPGDGRPPSGRPRSVGRPPSGRRPRRPPSGRPRSVGRAAKRAPAKKAAKRRTTKKRAPAKKAAKRRTTKKRAPAKKAAKRTDQEASDDRQAGAGQEGRQADHQGASAGPTKKAASPKRDSRTSCDASGAGSSHHGCTPSDQQVAAHRPAGYSRRSEPLPVGHPSRESAQ